MITLTVLGTPAPKGSARAFLNRKTGRAFVAPGGARSTEVKIKAWSTAVREAAAEAAGERTAPIYVGTPLEVVIVFRIARPSNHWGTGKNAGTVKAGAPLAPMGKPDIDKLARTTLDAMTGVVFDDDSRIASLACVKQWAAPGSEGATIRVASMAGGARP